MHALASGRARLRAERHLAPRAPPPLLARARRRRRQARAVPRAAQRTWRVARGPFAARRAVAHAAGARATADLAARAVHARARQVRAVRAAEALAAVLAAIEHDPVADTLAVVALIRLFAHAWGERGAVVGAAAVAAAVLALGPKVGFLTLALPRDAALGA